MEIENVLKNQKILILIFFSKIRKKKIMIKIHTIFPKKMIKLKIIAVLLETLSKTSKKFMELLTNIFLYKKD